MSDKAGYVATSSTSQFYLPPKIVASIKEGVELGVAADKFFGSSNSKHSIGALGFLTDNLIDRENYYLQAAVIALSEVKHQAWYR